MSAAAAAKLVPFRFGDFLVERRALTEQQLLDVLADHWVSGHRLGESVVRKGYLGSPEVERLALEFEALQTIYV